MPDRALEGLRILVVEDEYFIASELMAALEQAGARVYGPVCDVARATEVASGFAVDAAVLDINLQGKMVFPAAAMLAQQGIPFVFASGYGKSSLPDEFKAAPCLSKPFDRHDLIKQLSACIARKLEQKAQATPH